MKKTKELYYLLVKRGKRTRLIPVCSDKGFECGSTIEREDVSRINEKPIPTQTWKIVKVFEGRDAIFLKALEDIGWLERVRQLFESPWS
ncbi:MAG: hypothetical protein PHG25_04220 [Candidatus Pacebacteria bacterium]|nr:hypothetical protein [Candidatus Paceibacterota bacterium]